MLQCRCRRQSRWSPCNHYCRVELPIDPDRRSTFDPGSPACHGDAFLIGLAPQHCEAFVAEVAEEGRIKDDDVILVTFDVLQTLLRRRVWPMGPQSGTGEASTSKY
jgi:hypothetical protein